jgi:HEAT repeat protein
MAMLTTVACSLSLLLTPQDAGTTPVSPSVEVQRIDALPATTIAIAGWNPRHGERVLDRYATTLPPGFRLAIAGAIEQVATVTGLDRATVETLARSPGALALCRDESGIGACLLVEVGAATDAVRSTIEKLTAQAGLKTTSQTTAEGHELYVIAAPAAPKTPGAPKALKATAALKVAWGAANGVLVAGTSPATVGSVLGRLTTAGAGGLAENARLDALVSEAERSGGNASPFAYLAIDLPAAVELARTQAAASFGPASEIADKVLGALQIDQIQGVSWAACDSDGEVHEHMRIGFPEPRSGFPALFTGTSASLDPQLATFAEPGVTSFSLFHLKTGRLVEEILGLLNSFDPELGVRAKAALRDARTEIGIDLEADVLSALGDRIAMMQWPATSEAPGGEVVGLLELSNPVRLDKALRRVKQLQQSSADGYNIYSFRGGMEVVAAVGERHVLLGPARRVRSVLHYALAKKADPRVAAVLRQAGEGTTAVVWTDVGATFEALADTMLRAAATTPLHIDFGETRNRLQAVLPALGELRSTSTVDPRGIWMRSRSPLGSFGGIALLGITLAGSAAGLDAPGVAAEAAVQASFAWRLGVAARAAQAAASAGRAPALHAMVAAGDLAAEVVGQPDRDGAYVVDGYRLAVLQPANPADAPTAFAVVAWPDAGKTGPAYACMADGVPMINEILTRGGAIAAMTPRDVFRDGVFGAELTSGWRHIDIAGDADPMAPTATGPDWVAYQTAVAAERRHLKLPPSALIELLASTHAGVAARAAHALGVLGVREAVPTLTEVVTGHGDEQVRAQAMAALVALQDPRSLPASRTALRDPDLNVRAFAAANVGKLRDAGAVDPLLELLARDGAHEADSDRAQALLSLADIGDPRCLSGAAASPVAGRDQEQALGWLFQELSPKLGPAAEVPLLMSTLGHEATVLRRYAIQRLGELGDPKCATALEHRLAAESAELRPLVEVSLAAVRGVNSAPAPTSGSPFQDWYMLAKRWYWRLDRNQRNLLAGGSAGFAILVVGTLVLLRRRRRALHAVDWAAMAAPSESFRAGQGRGRPGRPDAFGASAVRLGQGYDAPGYRPAADEGYQPVGPGQARTGPQRRR